MSHIFVGNPTFFRGRWDKIPHPKCGKKETQLKERRDRGGESTTVLGTALSKVNLRNGKP